MIDLNNSNLGGGLVKGLGGLDQLGGAGRLLQSDRAYSSCFGDNRGFQWIRNDRSWWFS
jgi:hypothetical protein